MSEAVEKEKLEFALKEMRLAIYYKYSEWSPYASGDAFEVVLNKLDAFIEKELKDLEISDDNLVEQS